MRTYATTLRSFWCTALGILGLAASVGAQVPPPPFAPLPAGCYFRARNFQNPQQLSQTFEDNGQPFKSIFLSYGLEFEYSSLLCNRPGVLDQVEIEVVRDAGTHPCPPPVAGQCEFVEPIGSGFGLQPIAIPEFKFPFPPGPIKEDLVINERLKVGYVFRRTGGGFFPGITNWYTIIGEFDFSGIRRKPPPPLPPPPQPPLPPPADEECDFESDEDACQEAIDNERNQGRIVYNQPAEHGQVFPSGSEVPVDIFFDIEDINPEEAFVEIEGQSTFVGGPPYTFMDTLVDLDDGEYTINAIAINTDDGTLSKDRIFQVGGCRVQITHPLPEVFEFNNEIQYPIFGVDETFSFEARRNGEDALAGPVLWSLEIFGHDQDFNFFEAQLNLTPETPGVTLQQEGETLFLDFDLLPIIPDGGGPPVEPDSMDVRIVASATPLAGEVESECSSTELDFALSAPRCQAKITSPSQASLFPTEATTITFTAEKRARTPGDFDALNLQNATIAWRLLVDDFTIDLEAGIPGVTVASGGESLTVEFEVLAGGVEPGQPLALKNRNLIIEAYIRNEFGNEQDRCKARRRTIFIQAEEEPCGAKIIFPVEIVESPAPTPQLVFQVDTPGPANQDPTLEWTIRERTPTGVGPEFTIQATDPGVLLEQGDRRLTIDFLTFRNGELQNRRLFLKVERTDSECAGESDSRQIFVHHPVLGQPGGEQGGFDPTNTTFETCQLSGAPDFPVSSQQDPVGCSNPYPPELRALIDKENVPEGSEAAQCSCPREVCSFVFNSMGDPVVISSGELVLREMDAGICFPGEAFRALRTYSSSQAKTGLFGKGWRFLYSRRIERLGDSFLEEDGFGTKHLYRSDGQGGYLPAETNGATFFQTPDNLFFLVTQPGGVRYKYSCGTGVLVEVADRFGNAYQFEYLGPGGALSRVTNTAGRTITFTHTPTGRVASMTLPDGTSTWTYSYQGADDEELVAVTDALGHTTQFGYTAGRLTSRTNAAGETRQWVFDAGGHVVQALSETGAVSSFFYDFDNRRTTWVDAEGGTTVYDWNEDGLVTALTNPVGAVWHYQWTRNGRLLEEIDPLGRRTTYGYENGLVTSVTDNLAQTGTIARDPSFALDQVRTAVDGAQWAGTFDATGGLLSETNPLGETWLYTRNPRGQVLTATSPLGNTTTHTYDAFGNRTSTTDALGATTTLGYDQLCRVTSATDPLLRTSQTEYLIHHLVKTTIDPLGQRRETRYDALYNPVRIIDVDGAFTEVAHRSIQGSKATSHTTDPLGNVTRFFHDEKGRTIGTLSPRGGLTSVEYDSRGRPVLTRDALGNEARTVFNPDGTVQKTVSPLGFETKFFYDQLGRLVRTEDALGNSTQSIFDARGFLIESIAADGASTRLEYDALGRVGRTIDALGNVTENHFDAEGRLVESVNARGFATHFEYDALGRQRKVVDALGGVRESVFDAAGQVTKTIDPVGRETLFFYDQLGRRTQILGPSGETTLTAYNPDGTVATVTNPDGHTTEFFEYDAANRLLATRDPLGGVVRSEFDAGGNQTALIDENGNRTTIEFDLLNRQTAHLDAKGDVVRHEFDPDGRNVKTTNARGEEILMAYDPLGRLLKKTLCAGEETFQYDPVGRRTLAENTTVTERWFHDPLGRVVIKTSTYADGTLLSSSFEYDPNSNATITTDSQGRTTQRTFDELDRNTEVIDARGRSYQITYNAASQEVRRESASGIITTRAYDGSGRLVEILHRDGESGNVLSGFEYEYSPGGNRIADTEIRGHQRTRARYTHDARDQLTRVRAHHHGKDRRGFREITYRYDPAGNRLLRNKDGRRETYIYNELNQIVGRDGENFLFDKDGNMLREPVEHGVDRVYEYDCESNLVRTFLERQGRGHGSEDDNEEDGGHHHDGKDHSKPHSSGKGKKKGHDTHHGGSHGHPRVSREELRAYSYNADGLKVLVEALEDEDGHVEIEERELRHWSDGQVLEDVRFDFEESSHRSRREHRGYVRLGGQVLVQIDDRSGKHGFRPGEDGDTFVFQDSLGSTVLTLRAEATSQRSQYRRRGLDDLVNYGYLPFGEQVEGDDQAPFTFTGLRNEGDDLLSAQFRHLRPGLGRWTAEDPAGSVDGTHLYRYSMSRPLELVDPTGLAAWTIDGVRNRILARDTRYGVPALNRARYAEPGRNAGFGRYGLIQPFSAIRRDPRTRALIREIAGLEFNINPTTAPLGSSPRQQRGNEVTDPIAAVTYVHESLHIEQWEKALRNRMLPDFMPTVGDRNRCGYIPAAVRMRWEEEAWKLSFDYMRDRGAGNLNADLRSLHRSYNGANDGKLWIAFFANSYGSLDDFDILRDTDWSNGFLIRGAKDVQAR